MEKEETSIGICEVTEFPDSIFYKTHCACLSDDHTQTLILETDGDGTISLSISSTIEASSYYPCPAHIDRHKSVWEDIKFCIWNLASRLRLALKIMLDGEVKAESTFLFQNKKQIYHYILALRKGMAKLEKFNVTRRN